MNHGIRPVNDVVDNCTLIALMTGNPTHVYDAKKINGELCVLQATENEDFIGLDGKNYKIAPGDLIVRDKQKTVSLAGIIGSKLTAVSAETTSFLVEVGNFNPTVVASTARRLNAQTLAARMCAKKVSLYATKLTGEHIYNFMLRDSSPQQIGALTNPLTTGPYKNKITIDYAAIQSLIATRETLSVFRIRSILRSLGFHIVRGVVLVPAHRDDVIINQDLVEEVMKIVSIDVINGEPVAPAMYAPDSGNEPYLLLQNLIDRLRALQLNHLHTYNLTDRDSALSFDLFGYGEPLNIAAAPERAYFRLSLLDGLLRALAYNLKRKNEAQALFEVQPILTARGDDHWHVCIILPQPLFAAAWHNQAGIAPDLLTLKGLAEVVTDNFGFTCEHQPLTTSDWLVPADALCLQVYDETIGYAGRIRPSALKRYGLEETPIYALDVNLDKLIKSLNRAQDQYVPYWHGQNVVRDITFSPGPKSTFNDFIKGIKQIPEIASWKLISSFVPETTDETKGAPRYTVRYCLQQREGTLTTEAISAIATKLHNTLKKLDFTVDE